MRKMSLPTILCFTLMTMLIACKHKEEEFKICATHCADGRPWTVESLDLGLPCFATKDTCTKWAAKNGYGDKRCITCN